MKDITHGDDLVSALNTDDPAVAGTTDYSETVFGQAMDHALGQALGTVPQSRGGAWKAARGAKTSPRT